MEKDQLQRCLTARLALEIAKISEDLGEWTEHDDLEDARDNIWEKLQGITHTMDIEEDILDVREGEWADEAFLTITGASQVIARCAYGIAASVLSSERTEVVRENLDEIARLLTYKSDLAPQPQFDV